MDVLLLQLEMSLLDRVHHIVAEVYQSAQGAPEDRVLGGFETLILNSRISLVVFLPYILESQLFCSSFHHPHYIEFVEAGCHMSPLE